MSDTPRTDACLGGLLPCSWLEEKLAKLAGELEREGAALREETIEECAKTLDDLADDPFFRHARLMTDAAMRIRALKGKP